MGNLVMLRKRDIKRLPPEVKRVVMLATGNTEPPPGWRETPGAMHHGRNRWSIPIEREAPDAR